MHLRKCAGLGIAEAKKIKKFVCFGCDRREDPSERIRLSWDVAVKYIAKRLPEHRIKQVTPDGFCIIYAFLEGLLSIGRKETFQSVAAALREQLQTESFQASSASTQNIVEEFDSYMEDPLSQYDQDTADLYLDGLGLAYKVNIVTFRSDCKKCVELNLVNPLNSFEKTLYFLRTESVHIDPVVPLVYEIQDENDDIDVNPLNEQVESICNVQYTDDLLSDDEMAGAEISEGQTDDEIVMTGSIGNVGPLNVQDCDIDFNKNPVQAPTEETQECRPETSAEETAEYIPEDFNFSKPSAKHLLHCILENPTRYEVSVPLKGCRRNRVYTIKDFSFNQIKCDDNGAYYDYNTSNHEFVARFDEDNVFSGRGGKEIDGKWIYTERVGRKYNKLEANLEDVYTLKQTYRKSRSFPGLEHRVVTAEQMKDGKLLPFTCVVYIQNNIDVNDFSSTAVQPHGNSMRPEVLVQPYYRTSEDVLSRMDQLLETQSPSLTFDAVLQESGGPMHSTSISDQPRNNKQAENRKHWMRKQQQSSVCNTSGSIFKPMPVSNLDKLLAAQRDPLSPVRTVLVYDDCYVAFLYSDKQLKDIELFCCKDVECSIFGIDTTFKLCDMWLTDTSLRNHRLLSTRNGKHPVLLGPCMLHFRKTEESFRRFCGELLSANPSLENLKKVGTDMESAIYGGFKSLLPKLLQLLCVRHLQP